MNLLLRFLGRCLPADRRDDVLGDLEELHQNRLERMPALAAVTVTLLNTCTFAGVFLWMRLRDRRSLMPAAPVSALEVKLALRLLRRQPVLSFTAIAALTLGIAIATVGFTLIDAAVRSELPVTDGERFVRFDVRRGDGSFGSLRGVHFEALESAGTLSHVGRVEARRTNVVADLEGAVRYAGTHAVAGVSIDTFRQVPVQPLIGRSLIEADGKTDATPVALVSEDLWRTTLGGDSSIVGEILEISGREYTVVGVLPASYSFPHAGDVWHNLSDLPPADEPVSIYAVRAPGVSLRTVNAELASLLAPIERDRLGDDRQREHVRAEAIPYTRQPGPMGLLMIIGLVVPMLVVAVIAANVANLVRARTAVRSAELGLRTVLGASRSRLISQLSIEAAVLGLVAAVFGTAIAAAALRWFDRAMTEAPYWVDFSVKPQSAALAAGLALLVTLVCGLLPALATTRRNAGASITAWRAQSGIGRASTALMVTQMAMSIALLSGALLMARALWTDASAGGLDLPEGRVLTAQVQVPESPATPGSEVAPAPQRVLDALKGVAGIEALGTSDHLPRINAPETRIEVEPLAGAEAAPPQRATRARASAGYLESLGATPLVGRLFEERDLEKDAPRVAVVTQPFVERLLGDAPAVGRRFRSVPGRRADAAQAVDGPWIEIVGVVPDVGLGAGDPLLAAGYLLPEHTSRRYFYLAVLADQGSPEALAPELRSTLLAAAPDLVLTRVQPLDQVNSEERAFQASFGATLSALGVTAFALSLLGLYAMISLAVTRRTREFGVRRALGASRVSVLRQIVGRASLHLALGGALGAVMSFAFLQLQDKMLAANLPLTEPWILPAVLFGFAVAGTTAALVPAARALRTSPVDALRAE